MPVPRAKKTRLARARVGERLSVSAGAYPRVQSSLAAKDLPAHRPGTIMIIDCHGHYTTALREPLEKAGLKYIDYGRTSDERDT